MPPVNNNNKSQNGDLQHSQTPNKSNRNDSFSINENAQKHGRIEETSVTQNPPKSRGN